MTRSIGIGGMRWVQNRWVHGMGQAGLITQDLSPKICDNGSILDASRRFAPMNAPQAIQQVTAEAFAQRMANATPDEIQLIDVREPQEAAIAHLPGFTLLPLSQSEQWTQTVPTQLDPHKETYVLCHHGMRSAQMCQWLMAQGFTQVHNIQGGIEAYSVIVDSSIPRY